MLSPFIDQPMSLVREVESSAAYLLDGQKGAAKSISAAYDSVGAGAAPIMSTEFPRGRMVGLGREREEDECLDHMRSRDRIWLSGITPDFGS